MQKRFLSALFLFALSASAVHAETQSFEITVAAGKHDRLNEPVVATLPLTAAFAKAQATLTDAGGKPVPCQLTDTSLAAEGVSKTPSRELHFILAHLKAGESAIFKASVDTSASKADKGFSWHDTQGEFTELQLDGKPVLRYVYKALDDKDREGTFKVFHHLFDLEGKQLVTKGPGGLYTHHRGIFYGFMKVTYDDNKVVDIWHCKDQTYQSGDKILSEETGSVLGRHRVAIGWHGKMKELFANEERELTVYNLPSGRLVEFTSRLTPVKGTVKLDGDPQHAGFHFRAPQEVADKTKSDTYYVRPDGTGAKGATRNWPAQKEHVNLAWDAMSFVLGEKRYTVAYLDKPTNPKEARFSERDYGRFGSYFVTEVTDKKPLTVNYRLWLQEGEMKGADVAALDTAFVDPVQVTVK